MAALDRLFDDGALTERPGGGTARAGDVRTSRAPGRSESALPLLPLPATSMRRGRHLFLSELDGPDYDQAVDVADEAVVVKEQALYPVPADERVGWTKEIL